MRKAFIISSGPSLDLFDWSVVAPEDFILAVNYAGVVCPRFDAVVVVDVWRPNIFDKAYPKDTQIFAFDTRGIALNGYSKCVSFLECPTKIRSSSGGLGLYILHRMGFHNIIAIGFDTHFSNVYAHAKSLIDLGYYDNETQPVCPPLKEAVELAISSLRLNVKFFRPST